MENPGKQTIEKLVEAVRRSQSPVGARSLDAKVVKLLKADGGPIIRRDSANFFFVSKSDVDVSLIGDWNKWNPNVDKLERLSPHSSLYYIKNYFPIDAGLPYRFVVNGESILDPLNKNILDGPLGKNSYFGMAEYKPVEYWKDPLKKIKKGKIVSIDVTGNADVAARTVQVYIPNGLKLQGAQRVLYINDGAEALTIGRFANVLDNLYYYEPEVEKIVVVFVPPVDRHGEYMLNAEFSEWFANDLTEQVEKQLGITSRANLRAVQGASLGGLLAAHIGLNHYNKFRNIIAESPSFWVDDFRIVQEYAKSDKLPLKFFLHTGTIGDGLEGCTLMRAVLKEKRYAVTYHETNESHNWANWAGQYAGILRWFGNKS